MINPSDRLQPFERAIMNDPACDSVDRRITLDPLFVDTYFGLPGQREPTTVLIHFHAKSIRTHAGSKIGAG